MSVPFDVLHTVWTQIAGRNDWQLVQDEAAFFRRAAAEYEALTETASVDQRARGALMRVYGTVLYEGLQQRQERAAEELWLACYRLSIRDGWSPEHAQQVAQETVARVLDQLHTLRLPHSFIAWSLKICRTVRVSLKEQTRVNESLQHDDVAPVEAAYAADATLAVEQALIQQQIVALLHEKLPNSLERFVLLRIVLCGDHPRDVARDLGLPLYRTRVAKSRALHTLRADAQFLQLLADLTDMMK